jgi:hypothetical protein
MRNQPRLVRKRSELTQKNSNQTMVDFPSRSALSVGDFYDTFQTNLANLKVAKTF